MRAVLRVIFTAELLAALRVATFGFWWSARAERRRGKFSGNDSGALKGADAAQMRPPIADDAVAFDWVDRRMGREAK